MAGMHPVSAEGLGQIADVLPAKRILRQRGFSMDHARGRGCGTPLDARGLGWRAVVTGRRVLY